MHALLTLSDTPTKLAVFRFPKQLVRKKLSISLPVLFSFFFFFFLLFCLFVWLFNRFHGLLWFVLIARLIDYLGVNAWKLFNYPFSVFATNTLLVHIFAVFTYSDGL